MHFKVVVLTSSMMNSIFYYRVLNFGLILTCLAIIGRRFITGIMIVGVTYAVLIIMDEAHSLTVT